MFASQSAVSCDIRDFIVNDITSVSQSSQTELAFILTSSESEFNKAKEHGILDVFDLFSLGYNQAKSKAQQIAESINFDSKSSYAESYFSQTIDPSAIQAYEECLTHDTPGMYIWLSSRQGNYYTFKAFWVGDNTLQQIGKYDIKPSVTSPAKLIYYPEQWTKGVDNDIIVESNGKNDFLLLTEVSGKLGKFVIVHDPPNFSWRTKPVVSKNLLHAVTHGPNPGCSAGSAKDCIYPDEIGASFIPSTVAMVDSYTSDPSGYSNPFYKDSSVQVCVKMTQNTGACEAPQSAQGRLTALEKYPVADK